MIRGRVRLGFLAGFGALALVPSAFADPGYSWSGHWESPEGAWSRWDKRDQDIRCYGVSFTIEQAADTFVFKELKVLCPPLKNENPEVMTFRVGIAGALSRDGQGVGVVQDRRFFFLGIKGNTAVVFEGLLKESGKVDFKTELFQPKASSWIHAEVARVNPPEPVPAPGGAGGPPPR